MSSQPPAVAPSQPAEPDWASLKPRYAALTVSQPNDVHAWAGLAAACVGTGARAEGHRAADRALQLDSGNLRALLAKADLLQADGAVREANVYYRALVELGEGFPNMPADVALGYERARASQQRLLDEMASKLEADLGRAGWDRERSSERFTRALDIATQRKRAFTQAPRNFYYPELPNIQFYPREQFPWLGAIEAETSAITAELQSLMARPESFSPYLETREGMPSRRDYPLVDSLDWSKAWLLRSGEPTEAGRLCPRTLAALERAPLCQIPGRSPEAMFSQLRAGAHIQPHTGAVNTRLICHLPLIVPDGCWFRVGNETREWKVGEAWVFDDTIEHEAMNESDQPRLILIFDIWRPELTEEERGLVSALLASVDRYAPSKAVWE